MKNFIVFLFMLFSLTAFGQQSNTVEMADKFREEGKIYVVVAVVLIILIGMLTYVILLDRKISKLEREVNPEK
jgi:hypothetical protein